MTAGASAAKRSETTQNADPGRETERGPRARTVVAACRFCRAPLTRSLMDLGSQPLANNYLEPTKAAIASERAYPLHVKLCERCWLAQVEESLPADAIFHETYAYFSSYSSSWVAHAKRYAEAMVDRFKLGPRSRVVEAASNDGYLLQHFKAMGVPCLGVEPAANCAAAARKRGIETEVGFFNEATARKLVRAGKSADLTAANNVLAHVPDIRDFVTGFAILLKPEGVATFEFPHLLNMIKLTQFDTIYHEHYSYLSLLTVETVMSALNLRVFDVERLPTHGGSLRLFVCREHAAHPPTEALAEVRYEELEAGLDRPEGYEGFSARAEAIRDSFRAYLKESKAAGRRVAAYGAAAKGNTFLNYCGVDHRDLTFVVDRNPEKQGRLLPGSHVPVVGPEALKQRQPDDVLILPWNLADEIAAEHAYIRGWGGRFAVASPAMRFF